jgi:hypothetical protein
VHRFQPWVEDSPRRRLQSRVDSTPAGAAQPYSALASASQSFDSASCALPLGSELTELLHELAAAESASLALSLPLSSAFVAESPTEVHAASKAVPEGPLTFLASSVHAETAESTDCSALLVSDDVDEVLDEESSSPHPTAIAAQTASAAISEKRDPSMACAP